MKTINITSGVLLGHGEYDWIAGANSPIEKTVLIPDLNWKPWLSNQEIQVVNLTTPYDTLFCVTFSALAIISAIMNYMIANGLMPEDKVKWLKENGYIDETGKINFSERFTGTLGETTNRGAYQYKIANAIKNYGLIPQKDLELAESFTDNINKDFITEANYEKGREFKKRFYINWEWVYDIEEALKYSPVQGIVKFANYSYPEEILVPTGSPDHAVAGIFTTPNYNLMRDSYWQEFKRYAKTHTYSLMAFNITILSDNNMDTKAFVETHDLKWVQNSNTGQFGRILRGKVMIVPSNDRASALLIDDKMRTEPSIKINQADWDKLKEEGYMANF